MNKELLPKLKLNKNSAPKSANNQKGPINKSQLKYLILVILLSGVVGFLGGTYAAEQNKTVGNLTQSVNKQVINSESELITEIAKEVGESVVSIDVESEQTRRGFFGDSQSFTQASAGTGVIVSEDGVIITNRHVTPKNTSVVSVTLSDGTTLDDVEVIGRTNDSDPLDIAFLKVKDKKDKDLKPAQIGNSSEIEVGDKVIAIGNALGQFQNTVTSGIISGFGRSVQAFGGGQDVETLQNLFQTDASINEGNSGGPLVDIDGKVIGINTAVAGGGAENIGFAIPIDDIKGLISSVLDEGKLLRPYLGVRYVTLNDDSAYFYNLDTTRGAYIAPTQNGQDSILKDSPAQKAGLQEKDIITKVNDQDINEKNSLVSALGKYSVGEEVELTIVRDGNEEKIKVTLEAAPES